MFLEHWNDDSNYYPGFDKPKVATERKEREYRLLARIAALEQDNRVLALLVTAAKRWVEHLDMSGDHYLNMNDESMYNSWLARAAAAGGEEAMSQHSLLEMAEACESINVDAEGILLEDDGDFSRIKEAARVLRKLDEWVKAATGHWALPLRVHLGLEDPP